jgi:hypothetical protein
MATGVLAPSCNPAVVLGLAGRDEESPPLEYSRTVGKATEFVHFFTNCQS